jgi:dTDP-4-dehydrorhamnose reductase
MRILVTGASGRLGLYVLEELVRGPLEVVAWSNTATGTPVGVPLVPVELDDNAAVAARLDEADPDVVIHAAAISSAEVAHRDPARCEAVNVGATRHLSEWTARNHRRLVFTSTDLVFDGQKGWYREDDQAVPTLDYGRTKRAAEDSVLANPDGLVVRISLVYGPSHPGREGFFDRAIASMRAGLCRAFFADEYRTPIDYVTVSRILARLVESPATGLLHVGGPERLSRYELMRRSAAALGIDPSLVRANLRADVPSTEARPADLSLDTSRLRNLLPDLDCPGIERGLAGIQADDRS